MYNGHKLCGRIQKGEWDGMDRLAIFLAEGFEEIEALAVVDLCRRCGLQIDMVSVTGSREVAGAHGISVKADRLFEETVFADYSMLLLPGGMPGTKNLEAHDGLMEQLDAFYEAGKYIGAICAAPTIFGHRGFLKVRKACCYPGMEEQLTGAVVTEGPVETAGHVVTSRGMGTAIDFGLAVVGLFCGQDRAEQLAKAIVHQ